MEINLFKREHFSPHQLLVIYKSSQSNFYVETAKIRNGSPEATQPLNQTQLQDFAKTILGDDQGYSFSSSGLLTPDLLSFSMREGKFSAVWKVRAAKRKLLFTKASGIKSGSAKCPPLLFKVKNDELSVFALRKSGKITEVCHVPLPNIYENGEVCLGNTVINCSTNSLPEFLKYWEAVFFQSYFSDHGVDSGHVKINIPNLWNNLIDTQVEFPMDKLVPTGATIKRISDL